MPRVGLANRIGLFEEEFDLPIYRIYRLDRFEQLLKTNTDVLVNPSRWADPFENFFLSRTAVQDISGSIRLENLASDWYGQCWSFYEETDAMWRIYSPTTQRIEHTGVKVKSSIRRVFENLVRFESPAPYLQFFTGRVVYMEQHEIAKLMHDLTFQSIALGGQGEKFAQLLCVKRTAFRHENEMRLLFQDIQPNRGVNGLLTFPLDANALFDEVILDPRLKDGDVGTVTADLVASGCKLPIRRSPELAPEICTAR